MEILCPWESPQSLIFSSNAPTLLYYSHFAAVLISVIFLYLLISRSKGSLATKIFIFSLTTFIAWLIIDVLLWAHNRPDIVLFYWSLQVLLEVFLYSSAFYFTYVFLKHRDLGFYSKFILALLILPVILLLPTTHLLPGIDISYCDAIESPFLIFYVYIVEILLVLSILFTGFKEINKDTSRKKEVGFFIIAMVIFLLSFSSGNIIGSLTEDWELAQVGLFGTPIFIAMLTYLAVKFKTFNIKLIGIHALVVSLWILLTSLLLIKNIEYVRIVTALTSIIFLMIGIQLVRGVRREILLREQLQVANEGQANLLHIINHQIKGYFSKSRSIFSELITDPGYRACTDEAKPLLDEGLNSMTEGVGFVTDFLNASNIEKGTYKYEMGSVNFKDIVSEVSEKQKGAAEDKGLSFEVDISEGDYDITGDKRQLSQAIRNLIDNSIKYTPKGGLDVVLERKGDKVLFFVKDTGVGISEELKPRLFTKGGRGKDSLKININSTGFGLAFVRGVAEAHKGRAWAESDGENKGSTFYLELPVA